MGKDNETTAEGTYFQEWYANNGDELNKSRRDKYRDDPEYREKILKQNREARKKRRKEALKEKRKKQAATKTRTAQSWKAVTVELEDKKSGQMVPTKMFTIGAVAKALGCSVQALRLWEKKGVIPEASFRYSKGDRLYTAEAIDILREVLAKQKRLEGTKPPRPLPYVERAVRLVGPKREEKMRLFRIGVLAKTVGRTVVTLEQLEQRGALPETPFRASKVGYRLYSREMMEAVKASFDKRLGEIRGEDAWQEFHDEVQSAWKSLGVVGARILE